MGKFTIRLLGLNHAVFSEKIESELNSIMSVFRKFTKRRLCLNHAVVSEKIENLIA